jgi:hypothetical protein
MPAVLTQRWLGASEAARTLGCSVSWIRILAAQGRLPYTDTPLGKLFSVEDVQRFAVERVAQKTAGAAGE